MKKILAVDVDETCVDVLPLHLQWCNIFAGTDYTMSDIDYEYDLTNVFSFDGVMDFWSTPHLYQKLQPKEGCIEALTKLNNKGWEIGFVTYAKKAHMSSKCKWIKQHFPFYKFIHCSKEKGYTSCTHFIEDRAKYLNQMPDSVKLLQMKTHYKQDEILKMEATVVASWKEVYEILKGELDNG